MTAPENTPENTVLSAQSLVVNVGGDTEILHGMDLDLHSGEVLGLIGPNGAGKSTLLGALAGDLAPARGNVLLAGRSYLEYSAREAAHERAVMLQDSRVSFSHLVRDVVSMGRSAWPSDPERDNRIIDDCLRQVGMEHMQDRDITTLSGGERARVAFARVMAQRSGCMMLDEPTAAMDIGHQERTMLSVRALAEGGTGIIVVLHDLNLAAHYCDRLALLSEGRIAAVGDPSKVCTAEQLSAVYGWPVSVSRVDGQMWIRPAPQ